MCYNKPEVFKLALIHGAIATVPIAQLSERYNARQPPLILGLLILIGSQILLMEAPSYPVMCVARSLQGVGSSVVWVVGLALLCAPDFHLYEKKITNYRTGATLRTRRPSHVIIFISGKIFSLKPLFLAVHMGFVMSGLSVG